MWGLVYFPIELDEKADVWNPRLTTPVRNSQECEIPRNVKFGGATRGGRGRGSFPFLLILAGAHLMQPGGGLLLWYRAMEIPETLPGVWGARVR